MRQPALGRHRAAKFGGRRRVGRQHRLARQPTAGRQAPQSSETLLGGGERRKVFGAAEHVEAAGGAASASAAGVHPIQTGSLDGEKQRLAGRHVHPRRGPLIEDVQMGHNGREKRVSALRVVACP